MEEIIERVEELETRQEAIKLRIRLYELAY